MHYILVLILEAANILGSYQVSGPRAQRGITHGFSPRSPWEEGTDQREP